MTKPGVGVVIGRFQVHRLHDGHRAIINEAGKHQKLLIVVGVSAHLVTPSDPLDYPTRVQMLKEQYPLATIVPLGDQPTDRGWSHKLDELVSTAYPTDRATVYFGRGSSLKRYLGRHAPAEIEMVSPMSGTDVRAEVGKRIEDNEAWRAGVIYAAHNMWSRAVPVVDIAVTRPGPEGEGPDVLLGQRQNEGGKWRFPGGHIDVMDSGALAAAKRELTEETGLEAADFEIIGNYKVTSWRDTQGCAMFSTFFRAKYVHGAARASSDLDSLEWIPYRKLTHRSFMDSHSFLVDVLIGHLSQKGELP